MDPHRSSQEREGRGLFGAFLATQGDPLKVAAAGTAAFAGLVGGLTSAFKPRDKATRASVFKERIEAFENDINLGLQKIAQELRGQLEREEREKLAYITSRKADLDKLLTKE